MNESPIPVRPAMCREELECAYRLVYRSYLRRGYIEPSEAQLRLSLYNALPDTITFVGIHQDTVISTVSVVPDSNAGLPMDAVYHPELQQLRSEGRTLAEVTMLADRRVEIRRTLPMLLQLMKLVFDYAQQWLNANDLCITVNPRHNDFYRRYLLFSQLGELRSYPSVQNHPAIAQRLNLDTISERCRDHALLTRLFFEKQTPRSEFERGYRMTPEDVTYFAEQTDIVHEAPPPLLDILRKQIPQLPWDKWNGAAVLH